MKDYRPFISAALKKELPDTQLGPISTDSRSLRPGEVFICIRGDQFDGHQFMEAAAASGASLIIGEEALESSLGVPYVQVKSTIEAVRSIASEYRKSLSTQFIVVAGSNGKTTTKEYTSFLLRGVLGESHVFKSPRSENSILGIALNLLRIQEEKCAVLEVGIDEPGWMHKHLDLIQPDFGLITSIQEEHLEKLKDLKTVADEELGLLRYLREHSGAFAANWDIPFVRNETLPKTHLSFALNERAAIEGRFKAPRTLHAFGLEWANPLPGLHNAQNLLAALCAVRLYLPEIEHTELRKLAELLPQFEGEPHRSLYREYPNQIYVYDDCYNANPSSMEAALQTFLELTQGLSTIAVIGDMFELADTSESAHKRILNLFCVSGFEKIFTFGRAFELAASQNQKSSAQVLPYTDIDELKRAVKDEKKNFQSFFLKASRGNRLERVLEVFES